MSSPLLVGIINAAGMEAAFALVVHILHRLIY